MTLRADRRFGDAVVLGSSMAGLLAARVLSDHFETVTVVERDRLAHEPAPRKGVPQGRHIHALLIRGEQGLSRFFPDLVPELVQLGAERVFSQDVAMHAFGSWKLRPRFDGSYSALCFSRPLLEWQVARRVAALPNVRVLDETDILGILPSDGRSRIEGALVQRRGGDAAQERLRADLVVDATGRGSKAPQWLGSLGYLPPREEELRVDVAYASRIYRRPARDLGWQALNILPTPPGKSMGAIFPIEGDRWMVTLVEWFSKNPPEDEETFLRCARALPVPDLHDAIRDAEPLTPVVNHRLPSSRRRRYEEMTRSPEGLIVIGDALCSFNPVYAQGITVCALSAEALDDSLRAPTCSTRRAQRRIAAAADVPWTIVTGEDRRFPEAAGPRPPWLTALHWYGAKLQDACARDEEVLRAFADVNHMLRSPAALFRPDIVLRVLRSAVGA